jgi:hypothetical protein
MTKHKRLRNIYLNVSLNAEELEKVNELFSNSMCQNRSDYVRKRILAQPITVKYRNRSVDAFVAEIIVLRNELSSIGSGFNQLVRELTVAEDAEMTDLAAQIGTAKEKLFEKVNEIKEKINKFSDLWSQTSMAEKVLRLP